MEEQKQQQMYIDAEIALNVLNQQLGQSLGQTTWTLILNASLVKKLKEENDELKKDIASGKIGSKEK